MPNIKSAKKRVLTNKRNKIRNKAVRSKVRTQIKKFNKAVAQNDIEKAEALLPETFAVIDKSKSKGVFHKNTTARFKAAAASKLNLAKDKPALLKEEVKKEVQPVKATPVAKIAVTEVKKETVKKTPLKTAPKKISAKVEKPAPAKEAAPTEEKAKPAVKKPATKKEVAKPVAKKAIAKPAAKATKTK